MVPLYIKNCVGSVTYLHRNVEFSTRHVLFCMVWRIRFNTSTPSASTVAPKSNLIRLLVRRTNGAAFGLGLTFYRKEMFPFRFAKYRFFISFRPISFCKVQIFHFVSSHFVSQSTDFHFVSFHFVSSHFVSSHFVSSHFVSQSTITINRLVQ